MYYYHAQKKYDLPNVDNYYCIQQHCVSLPSFKLIGSHALPCTHILALTSLAPHASYVPVYTWLTTAYKKFNKVLCHIIKLLHFQQKQILTIALNDINCYITNTSIYDLLQLPCSIW